MWQRGRAFACCVPGLIPSIAKKKNPGSSVLGLTNHSTSGPQPCYPGCSLCCLAGGLKGTKSRTRTHAHRTGSYGRLSEAPTDFPLSRTQCGVSGGKGGLGEVVHWAALCPAEKPFTMEKRNLYLAQASGCGAAASPVASVIAVRKSAV